MRFTNKSGNFGGRGSSQSERSILWPQEERLWPLGVGLIAATVWWLARFSAASVCRRGERVSLGRVRAVKKGLIQTGAGGWSECGPTFFLPSTTLLLFFFFN